LQPSLNNYLSLLALVIPYNPAILNEVKNPDIIHLTIHSPERTILEKMVSKVSLPGSKGRFMVLKAHAPLISSLEEGRITFVSDGVEENVDIQSGFVEIAFNKIIVCVEL
jgi:F-type H+-transporting ATPase subunit epsilon